MRHQQPPLKEPPHTTPASHIEAARLVVTTWSRIVLTTTASTGRGTCGPLLMVSTEVDALVELLGEASQVTVDETGEATLSLTCPIDGYVVVLEIELL